MLKLQPSPEVLRSIDARLSAGLFVPLLTLLTSGCLSGQIGMDETGIVLSSSNSSSGESGENETSSGDSGIMTTTEDPDRSTGDTVSSEPGTDSDSGTDTSGTTGIPVMCGDGVLQVEGGEACDEGAANADDGACTSHCQIAQCGDGLVHAGVEVCDDGVNDGSYDGCAADCAARAGYCGDGIVQGPMMQGPEKCDGGPANSGCINETCTFAKSCKEIKDAFGDAATDGVYTIAPKDAKLTVVCDMDADGGGYTFLKVAQADPVSAKVAEGECAKFGMRLLVPRSKAHLAAAVQVAQSDVLSPIGPGIKASLDYLKIFGIYRKQAEQSCPGKPFNNVDCPQWTAFGEVFWVNSKGFADGPYMGEPAVKDCPQCSLDYYWEEPGTLIGYESVSGGNNVGAKSDLFMCEVADKLPPK